MNKFFNKYLQSIIFLATLIFLTDFAIATFNNNFHSAGGWICALVSINLYLSRVIK